MKVYNFDEELGGTFAMVRDEAPEEKATVITPGGRVGSNARHGSRSNGENWVERTAGELPEYIRIVRNGIMDKNPSVSEGHATALAVAAMKKWARGGGNVSAKVRAAAAAALAKWEAMKAASHAKKDLKGASATSVQRRRDDAGAQESLRNRVDAARRSVERRRERESVRKTGHGEGRNWDEHKHPRKGGKFAPKGSTGDTGDSSVRGSDVDKNVSAKYKDVPDSWKKRLPLKYGDQSPAIQSVQEVLDAIPGIPKTEKDGIYGDKTVDAIKAMQKQAGLKPTGVLDEDTFAAIINYKSSPKKKSK